MGMFRTMIYLWIAIAVVLCAAFGLWLGLSSVRDRRSVIRRREEESAIRPVHRQALANQDKILSAHEEGSKEPIL